MIQNLFIFNLNGLFFQINFLQTKIALVVGKRLTHGLIPNKCWNIIKLSGVQILMLINVKSPEIPIKLIPNGIFVIQSWGFPTDYKT